MDLQEFLRMGGYAGYVWTAYGLTAAVLVLRRTRPELPRPFRVPAAPVVCTLGALSCLWLFGRVFLDNWHWMTGWIAIGVVIYFSYGQRHSALNQRG